ncbi:hypothetical protein AVEN_37103-1, partial [Araneus ventricosus]
MTCTEVNIATVNRKRRPVLMEIGCDTMPSFVAMSRRTTTQLYNKAGAKLRAGKESGCRWGWTLKVGQTIRGVLVGKKESSARIFQCSAMARLAKVIFCLIALGSMEADCILFKKTKKVIRNQSIGQFLSVHKDSFSNTPTNRRLEEAVAVDWPKMMKFKDSEL